MIIIPLNIELLEIKKDMGFQKYAFIASKVRNVNLFKIVEEPLHKPFAPDTFRETVIKRD